MEGISSANAGKILRILRLSGFIESARGQTGGYRLTRAPAQIAISEVLTAMGGKLYESGFCDLHSGIENICTNSIDCSIRSLWKTIQTMLDDVLDKLSLQDLLGKEQEVEVYVANLTEAVEHRITS